MATACELSVLAPWQERLGRASRISVAQLDEEHRLAVVKRDGCGGLMRCRYALSKSRVLRSCNLLPNVMRPIARGSTVLRLVVSVANFWGSSLIACLDRPSRRSRRLWSLGHWSPWRLVAANRVRLSRCLDEGIAFWSAPAPATQCIALSTRAGSARSGVRSATRLTRACTWYSGAESSQARKLPCGPRLLKEC